MKGLQYKHHGFTNQLSHGDWLLCFHCLSLLETDLALGRINTVLLCFVPTCGADANLRVIFSAASIKKPCSDRFFAILNFVPHHLVLSVEKLYMNLTFSNLGSKYIIRPFFVFITHFHMCHWNSHRMATVSSTILGLTGASTNSIVWNICTNQRRRTGCNGFGPSRSYFNFI